LDEGVRCKIGGEASELVARGEGPTDPRGWTNGPAGQWGGRRCGPRRRGSGPQAPGVPASGGGGPGAPTWEGRRLGGDSTHSTVRGGICVEPSTQHIRSQCEEIGAPCVHWHQGSQDQKNLIGRNWARNGQPVGFRMPLPCCPLFGASLSDWIALRGLPRGCGPEACTFFEHLSTRYAPTRGSNKDQKQY